MVHHECSSYAHILQIGLCSFSQLGCNTFALSCNTNSFASSFTYSRKHLRQVVGILRFSLPRPVCLKSTTWKLASHYKTSTVVVQKCRRFVWNKNSASFYFVFVFIFILMILCEARSRSTSNFCSALDGCLFDKILKNDPNR